MFGATKSNNGPDPKYAPTAAVTIDKASKLYTFLMKTSLSVVEAEAAAVTPRVSVAVDPNLIIFSLYLDEINGISSKYIETLSKSEIHTSEDFLNTTRADILTLKGFGEKTVDKLSAIIVEAVANKQAELKNKQEEEDVETDSTIEPVLDETENG